jgi:hypothetical protein
LVEKAENDDDNALMYVLNETNKGSFNFDEPEKYE